LKEDQGVFEIFKRAISGSARALSKSSDLEITFDLDSKPTDLENKPATPEKSINLPLPSRKLPLNEIVNIRGLSDSSALKKRYHDEKIHNKNRPNGQIAQEIYDSVEKVRFEALGSRKLSGVANNIHYASYKNYAQNIENRKNSEQDSAISEALSIFLREKFTGLRTPKDSEELIKKWKSGFEKKGKKTIRLLSKNLDNQEVFSSLTNKLIKELNLQDSSNDQDVDEENNLEDIDENTNKESNQSLDSEKDDDEKSKLSQQDIEDESKKEIDETSSDTFENEGEQNNNDFDAQSRKNSQITDSELSSLYNIFSSEFDEVKNASDLCENDELIRLRKQLDQQLNYLDGTVGKLANRLQRRLLARQSRAWDFDLEEGLLDSSRLSRVIINPSQSLSYKKERDTNFRDTLVTLLIDNSGSMRGRPISVAAMCGDILARTLERCGVDVEILGFTTVAWKGGNTREKWISDGKPANPGRLNDLRHIIYKSAEQPWRRSRRNLGLMLKEGILKENIDGEALIWAHQRLLARIQQRKILMVISDGAPVDDSTLSVNPGNFLDKHLRQTINLIEKKSPVELIAIGIGHDVTRYYKKAVTIVDAEQLAGAMIEQLAALFNEEN
tara:strand:+ start:994 stop:2835 length:1842 start_codon:yes stop_codon:yes gene_type:complete